MSLSKEDIRQINQAIKDGDIDTARFVIQTSDDPRTAEMLSKLNGKYPPRKVSETKQQQFPLPPIADNDMDHIRTAIREKRYDDAESLLILSSNSEAEALLRKISLIRNGADASIPKAKNDMQSLVQPDFTTRLTWTILLLLFFTIPGIIALMIFIPEAKKYPEAPGAGGLLLLNRLLFWLIFGGIALFILALIFVNPS